MKFLFALILFMVFSLNTGILRANRALHYTGDSLIASVLASISSDSVESIIQTMQGFGNRFALADNNKEIATWVKDKFIDYGYTHVVLDSFLLDSIEWPQSSGNFHSEWQYNVIAKLQGSTDTNKYYILGAHYDAIVNPDAFAFTPGADDNASGMAAVFETARVFKKHNLQPKYNILFIGFAAEELYLSGSKYLAQKYANQNNDIVLMINNDMIAHNPNSSATWKYKIQKYPHTEWVVLLAEEVANTYTSLQTVIDSNAINYSDSYPFFLNGYDAVFFQEYDFNTRLHTTDDIIDHLDMAYAKEVIKISCGILLKQNITPQNITDNNDKISPIKFYPNPASNYLNGIFNSTTNEDIVLSFYDVRGRLAESYILKIESGKNYLKIHIGHLKNGLYNCIITTNKTTYNQRIIIIN